VATASAVALVLLLSATASAAPADLKSGADIGSIRISKIGLEAPLVQGGHNLSTAAWPATLNRGPAHYPDTPLPWQPGTAAFAGHRVTHTHPFRWLNLLKPGDPIVLKTKWGEIHYHVRKIQVVSPYDTKVLDWVPKSGYGLELTACNPAGQATSRIVVKAVRVPV
jgi:sortase A